MRLSERLRLYVVSVTLNAALFTFGLILICQGAVHKIATGQAEIRDVIVERATEPVSFWYSVGFDLLIGAMLALGAVYGLWLTFRRKPRAARQDEASLAE